MAPHSMTMGWPRLLGNARHCFRCHVSGLGRLFALIAASQQKSLESIIMFETFYHFNFIGCLLAPRAKFHPDRRSQPLVCHLSQCSPSLHSLPVAFHDYREKTTSGSWRLLFPACTPTRTRFSVLPSGERHLHHCFVQILGRKRLADGFSCTWSSRSEHDPAGKGTAWKDFAGPKS